MVPPWLASNPRARPDLEFGREQQFVIDPNGIPELCAMLTDCPKHSPTPLYALPSLAAKLGLGEIRVKDESQRFGFGAFKALGGVIAVYYELLRSLGEAHISSASFADIMNGRHRAITSKFTFATASSGNHGRSVAAGARLFGNPCFVFLPKFTSAEKEAAIRARGAQVIRVDGDYDTAVAECRRKSEANGWTIISDTSWPGYDSVPRNVMRGYCVLAHEAVVQQWPQGPTHVFVQAGVGGLAAAVIGYLWAVLPERPVFIVVEPTSADCWFQSNAAGRPVPASGNARHGHGRPGLSRDLARHLADRRRGHGLVHDHRGGRGNAGAAPVRSSPWRRSRRRLGTVGLCGAGRPPARLRRQIRRRGAETRSPLARSSHQQRRQPRRATGMNRLECRDQPLPAAACQ